MKKKIIILVSVIVVLALALGGMFLIDKNRMNNNMPVVFSTWGYDYSYDFCQLNMHLQLLLQKLKLLI